MINLLKKLFCMRPSCYITQGIMAFAFIVGVIAIIYNFIVLAIELHKY